jgi:spermidine synthase
MSQDPARPLPFPAVAALYTVSGALGLAYEVVFSKYLSLVFGATAYAASAVLVTYMGGLAAGAWLAGRSRWLAKRPLAAYGLAELVVGAACLLVTLAFPLLPSAYSHLAALFPFATWLLHLARALLAALAVFVPTVAMGSTLPLLASSLLGEHGKRRLSWLYASNTLGGAAGAIACAYLILPALGLSATMRGAALVSFAVGTIAIAAGRTPQTVDLDPAVARSPRNPRLEALALCSGLLVFVAEVVFVHLLALVIGTSAYAFGLMIAIFLSCLGIGASIAARWLSRVPAAMYLGMAAAGLLIIASLPLWDRTPAVFESLGPIVTSWQGRELVRALVATVLLALPVVAMGTTFPLVLHEVGGARTARAQVGRLAAFNTVGAIAGSLLGGFVLLPNLGSERSLAVVAAAYILVACTGYGRLPARARVALGAAATCAIVLAAVRPRWDLFRLTSGANVYFEPGEKPEQIVMIREDVHGGVTTVTRDAGVLTLLTNGKFQGNDSHEIQAQRGFGHVSAIHAPRSGSALVIGLGTGTTAGVLAAHGFGRVDVAEISPAIVQASRAWFGHINGAALQEPRVHVYEEDGRNLLLMSRHTYDLVAIEITSIWFAGAANLYNDEFYRLARSRLSEGGILQQWVQLHHMPRRILASILATLRAVFPHVVVYVRGNQGIIIASCQPTRVSRARLAELQARPAVTAMLGPGESLEAIVADAVLVDDSLDRFLAEAAQAEHVAPRSLISTDDNMLLEYATPRANVPGLPDIIATSWLMRPYRPEDIVSRILTE